MIPRIIGIKFKKRKLIDERDAKFLAAKDKAISN